MISLLRHISGFFFSLRTTIWALLILIVMLFAGAFIMPVKQEFRSIHTTTFFQWLSEGPLSITWWLWASIGILTVIVINTVFCSIESIIRKRKVTQWLLLISPQIIHVGFLFILLAHLLSALGGSQYVVAAEEGSFLKISKESTVHVKDINIQVNSSGYISDWEVKIDYYSEPDTVIRDMIRPNSPSVQMGLNINLKDLKVYPKKAVLLKVSKEPGALWALIGGILFMTGIFVLLVLKIKTDKKRTEK